MNETRTQRKRTARPKTQAELCDDYPISIIVPFYNSAAYFETTLQALRENDLRNTEVLLVDDGSSDDGPRIAAAVDFGTEPRILSGSGRNGPALARNQGAEEAQHPYLFFLDADIILPANSLHWIRETLDIYQHRPEVRGVLGLYSANLPVNDFYSNYKNLYVRHLYDTTPVLSPFVHTPIFCLQKEIFGEVGGFDGRLETAEDFRLGVALGSRGHRFVIDRRIQGIHLKSHTLSSILKEDRHRIIDLRRVELAPEERDFYFRAHRWSRLASLLLPALIVLSLLLSVVYPLTLWGALVLGVLFVLLNNGFLRLCRRQKGFWFALGALLFLGVEMAWASLVGVESVLLHRRLGG